jgi:hypothetical protein
MLVAMSGTSTAGWPRRYPMAQPANPALAAMFLAAVAGRALEGDAARNAGTAYLVAAAIWSADELTRGINLFRRTLGLVVLAHSIDGLRRRFGG